MSTLSERQRAILDLSWKRADSAQALDRLCDQLTPYVSEALANDRETDPFGIPTVVDDESPLTPVEITVMLAVAWIEALTKSATPRGPDYLSDLGGDLLPVLADLSELFDLGKSFGLAAPVVVEIFGKMKRHRPPKLPLPREALRLLKVTGFFAKKPVEPGVPTDLRDALEAGDCGFVWIDKAGFVLNRENGSICHVVKVSKLSFLIEGRTGDNGRLLRHHGWARERIGTVILNGVAAQNEERFTLDGFRMFLSQLDLGVLDPLPIRP